MSLKLNFKRLLLSFCFTHLSACLSFLPSLPPLTLGEANCTVVGSFIELYKDKGGKELNLVKKLELTWGLSTITSVKLEINSVLKLRAGRDSYYCDLS